MKKIDEKRRAKRVKINQCPISLRLSDNDLVDAMIIDLSSGGIQFQCDRITAHKVRH